jgi:hypothetical protein
MSLVSVRRLFVALAVCLAGTNKYGVWANRTVCGSMCMQQSHRTQTVNGISTRIGDSYVSECESNGCDYILVDNLKVSWYAFNAWQSRQVSNRTKAECYINCENVYWNYKYAVSYSLNECGRLLFVMLPVFGHGKARTLWPVKLSITGSC